MKGQAPLNFDPPAVPAGFDGATFDPAQDAVRLGHQLAAVKAHMADGRWRTLSGISLALGFPESSVSARLRDLRKPKFGSATVERRRVPDGNGLWEYRVVA